MSEVNFDNYVNDYRNIINKVSSISGEQFEYFIQLRLHLLIERLEENSACNDTIRILDFGCGTGTTEIYLKKLFPKAEIFAVDSSVESIRAAQEIGLEDINFIHSVGIHLPFPDGYFDIIYSNGTYHHIEPSLQENFIKEMLRICQLGGNLFIFENNPKNPLMMRAMRENPFDKGAIAVSPSSLQAMASRLGFTCKDISYYFFFPRFLRYLRFMEKSLRKIPLGAQYVIWAKK